MTTNVRKFVAGGVSNPTGTRYGSVWTRCPACHRLDFHQTDNECHACGYNTVCGACGTDINATDYFTPFACSASCDAEMGAWGETDRKAHR